MVYGCIVCVWGIKRKVGYLVSKIGFATEKLIIKMQNVGVNSDYGPANQKTHAVF